MAKKKKEGSQVKLGPRDAALIMYEKGGYNLMLPDYEPDETVPENILMLTGMAMGLGTKDERLTRAVAEILMDSKEGKALAKKHGQPKRAASPPKARARRKA